MFPWVVPSLWWLAGWIVPTLITEGIKGYFFDGGEMMYVPPRLTYAYLGWGASMTLSTVILGGVVVYLTRDTIKSFFQEDKK